MNLINYWPTVPWPMANSSWVCPTWQQLHVRPPCKGLALYSHGWLQTHLVDVGDRQNANEIMFAYAGSQMKVGGVGVGVVQMKFGPSA